MARRWIERDHPRHPGGSGEQSGRFRERVGSGGWAMRLASAIGQGRTRSVAPTVRLERDPRFESELREPDPDDLAVGPEGDYDVQSYGGDRMDEGGNLPRLTNQEVAQALAPERPLYTKEAWLGLVDEAIRESGFDPGEVAAAWGDGSFAEDYDDPEGDWASDPYDFVEAVIDNFMGR